MIVKKCLGTLHLPPYEILTRVRDLYSKNTKEEVELSIAEYSLKPACTAFTDRSNSRASGLWAACGPEGTTLGVHEWSPLASLELRAPHLFTEGDWKPTVIFNFGY